MTAPFILTNQISPDDVTDVSLESLERLVCLEMELAWKRWARTDGPPDARPPLVEVYLSRFPQLDKPDVLLRLIRQEFSVRSRLGSCPQIDEYRSRFPEAVAAEGGTQRLIQPDELARHGGPADPPPTPDASTLRTLGGHPALSDPVAQVVGPYELLSELGRGSWGIVHKARHVHLRHLVALKLIRTERAEDLKRIVNEARAIAQAKNEGTVWIYDYNIKHDPPYIAMEYVEGGTLKDRIRAMPLSPTQAAELVEKLALALQAAHANSFIHRDLKPANVLLTSDGKPKITDFGLAQLLDPAANPREPRAVAGTPPYMAPEQARGEAVAPTTDVYALGAILYETLTGRPPFLAPNVDDILRQVVRDPPIPPRLLAPRAHPDLEAICLKCLRKEPRDRYPSARELANDLRRYQQGKSTLARPSPVWERAVRWVKRNPWPAMAAAIALVLVGVFVALSYEQELRKQDQDHVREIAQQKQYIESLYARHRLVLIRLLSEQEGLIPAAQRRSAQQFVLNHYLDLAGELDKKGVQAGRVWPQVYEEWGDLAGLFGRKTEAADHYQQAQTAYRALLETDSANRDYRGGLGLALIRRGALLQALVGRKPAETGPARFRGLAREEFDAALDVLLPLCRDHPDRLDFQLHLAEAYHNLGALLNTAQQRQEALEFHRQARDIRARVVGQSEDRAARRALALSWGFMGDVQLADGDEEAARHSYAQALALRERLVEEDARDLDAVFQLARSHENDGRYHGAKGNVPEAIRSFEKVVKLQEELVKLGRVVTDYQSDLGRGYTGLAELLLDSGRAEEARPHLAAALERFGPFAADGEPNDAFLLLGLIRCHLNFGKYYLNRAEPDGARADEHLAAADALLPEITRTDAQPAYLYDLAVLRALQASRVGLGKKEADLSDDEKVRRGGRVEDALRHLEDAVKKGYANTERMKRDVGLTAVRTGPRFAELSK